MRRRLGRTGIDVSAATLGTAMLAAPGHDGAEIVARALDHEVNAVELDASDAGDAATVDLLGGVLARDGRRNDVHIFARASTLVPFDLPSPHVPADRAYPGRHIRAETEALLARLGVERLALVQLHAWCPEWLDEGDWLETLTRLRDEGKIAGIGISMFDHDVDAGLDAVASGLIDAVQVMVNIFDQGALATLLPLCAKHDVAVIARSPLYYGALAGRRLDDFAAGDWRSGYFFEHARETAARVAGLVAALPDRSVADIALRFALSQPAVSTVAVGMTTSVQLEANLASLARGPVDADTRAVLGGHAWLC